MKVFIRTLWAEGPRPLWYNSYQRDELRRRLNDFGFYVLTGAGNSLEVYAIKEEKYFEEVLEKIAFFWYTRKGGKSNGKNQ